MSQVLFAKAVKPRHVVVTWFGNCSYRRLKVTYEIRKQFCPHCGNELVDADYVGNKVFCKNKQSADYVRDGWLPSVEDGRAVFVVRVHTPCKFDVSAFPVRRRGS
jgi:hypothetical protein